MKSWLVRLSIGQFADTDVCSTIATTPPVHIALVDLVAVNKEGDHSGTGADAQDDMVPLIEFEFVIETVPF